MYGSPKVPDRIQMSSFNVTPFNSALSQSKPAFVEASKPSLFVDVKDTVGSPRASRVAQEAADAVVSYEAIVARKAIMREHLSARIKDLRSLKQQMSLPRWWLTRISNDQSHEQSLYWKLIFASPSMSIDQYAFSLAYYHAEYQAKRHASSCYEECQQPGKCVLEGSPSPCKDCSWLNVQTEWCEKFISERSKFSDHHFVVDAVSYMVAACFIAWIAVASVLPISCLKRKLCDKKMLHTVQEISYQSFGYVYSTAMIEEYFSKWYYRLLFGCSSIFVQFVGFILFPLVEVAWYYRGGVMSFHEGNSQVGGFLVPALVMATGVLLSVALAVIPTAEETLDQKRYLDAELMRVLPVKVQWSESNAQWDKPKSAMDLLLLLVSQDTKRPNNLKRAIMVIISVIVACTEPCLSYNMLGAAFGDCSREGCGMWPVNFVIFVKVMRFLVTMMLVYMMVNIIFTTLTYIWRKRSTQERYLMLLQGCKAQWTFPPSLQPCDHEVTAELDLSERDTVLGFGMVLKVLESQDNTEKRRTESVIGISIVFFAALTVYSIVVLFGQANLRAVDSWILNWWTLELCVVIAGYLALIVLPNGLRINEIPAELRRVLTDQLLCLTQKKRSLKEYKRAELSNQQVARQISIKEQTHAIDSTKEMILELAKNLKICVYNRPFSLLGIELTIARVVGLGGTAATAFGVISGALIRLWNDPNIQSPIRE